VKCSDVKWREVMRSEVMWCVVQWCEVIILGEMCVISLVYSYVAVCRFCAVRCVCVSLLFASFLLFPNYSTYVFNVILCLCSCFVYLFSILCILCFCIVLCIVYILLYIAVSFLFLCKTTDRCHRVETQLQ